MSFRAVKNFRNNFGAGDLQVKNPQFEKFQGPETNGLKIFIVSDGFRDLEEFKPQGVRCKAFPLF